MTTRILIAVDIEDAAMIDAYGSTDYDADDLVASFDARLSEVYCGQHDVPVRAAVVALGDFSAGALWSLIQAAEVGCDIITVTPDLLKKLSLVGKDLGDYSLETVQMFFRDAQAAGYKL